MNFINNPKPRHPHPDHPLNKMHEETPYTLRVKAGYQRAKSLADAAGVNVRTLRKHEKGDIHNESEVVFQVWEKLAKVLGITPESYQLAVNNVKRLRVVVKGAR